MSRSLQAVAFTGLLMLLVVFAGSAGAATEEAQQTTVVLGNTSTMPDPSCPESPCQAIGSVTGFQVNNGQSSLPFRVNRPGRIKSWTLTLSQPTSSQRSFFNSFFGTPPEARLAILRRVAAGSEADEERQGADGDAQDQPVPVSRAGGCCSL